MVAVAGAADTTKSGVYRAASLDNDFAIYRYGPGLSKAFQVVR